MRGLFTIDTTSARPHGSLFRAAMTTLLSCFLIGSASAEVIEEIVVTARAGEQSVRDVPVSITAFNQETMVNMALRDLEDIAAYSSAVEIVRISSRRRDARSPVTINPKPER